MPEFEAMRLTERDKAIIAAVSRFRFLTTSLILSLVSGSRQNITRRLQRLYHAGFLDRPRAQLALRYAGELSDLVYCPGPKCDAGKTSKSTTSLFLSHALLVSEVLIRIEEHCRTHRMRFISEPELLAAAEENSRHIRWRVIIKIDALTEHVGVIPDAAFAVERTKHGIVRRYYYFLEADRGTMPITRNNLRLSSIRRKALAYTRSRSESVLKERFGIPGFQVIFITRSRDRLARIAEVCREVGGMKRAAIFRYSTTENLRACLSRSDALTHMLSIDSEMPAYDKTNA